MPKQLPCGCTTDKGQISNSCPEATRLWEEVDRRILQQDKTWLAVANERRKHANLPHLPPPPWF